MTTYYLCDGNNENCTRKAWCYKSWGPCKHTNNEKNAKNLPEFRIFVKNHYGDYWEKEVQKNND